MLRLTYSEYALYTYTLTGALSLSHTHAAHSYFHTNTHTHTDAHPRTSTEYSEQRSFCQIALLLCSLHRSPSHRLSHSTILHDSIAQHSCHLSCEIQTQSRINISPFSCSSQSLMSCTTPNAHCPIAFRASLSHAFDRRTFALPRPHIRLSHFRTSVSVSFMHRAAHDVAFSQWWFCFFVEFIFFLWISIYIRALRSIRKKYQMKIQRRINNFTDKIIIAQTKKIQNDESKTSHFNHQ